MHAPSVCCPTVCQDIAAGSVGGTGQATLWRKPHSSFYHCNGRGARFVSRTVKPVLRSVFVLALLVAMLLPAVVIALPTNPYGLGQVMAAAGEAAFMSAEHVARAKQDLEHAKSQPYSGSDEALRFSHSINAHLPEGKTSSIDPKRYVKDDKCGLVMDRVPGVSDEQLGQMRDMLREYAPHTVAYNMEQITGYRGVEPPMEIPLTTTAPIFCPARRNWSPAELEIIDEKCTELLDAGICVKISGSDYACNPVLAMKRAPDGTWSDKRFCVNFIPINKHTELDRYGSHKADDLFQRVVRAKFLTALDLRSGFHQIPMAPDSIAKTAFWYVSGRNQPPQLLAYERMPFGLKNASAKFQRVMDAELARSGNTEFAFAYIDDLLVASDTYEEHVEHVRRIMAMLREANLKIHPDKSVFGTNIIEYLGHNVIGQHGITMNEAKVESIKALPTPRNVPDLRSIMGFLAYYRHFIPGFSAIAAPMNDLLKKDVPWAWGPSQEGAYNTLKRLMTEPGRILRPVDPDRPLVLHTDWSIYGIGAVLGQKDDDGNEYLCACISRSLNKHERNYPSYKGELLALAWAIRMFRQHLFGTKFKVVTDHQPLLWLMQARDLNGQYARWQVLLQEYDFVVEHRAGIKHTNADVLSRFPCRSSKDLSGARFDEDPAEIASVMRRVMVLAAKPGIDSFAPRFRDLLHKGAPYVDENHYMDAAMRDPTLDELDPDAALSKQERRAAVNAQVALLARVPKERIGKAIESATSSEHLQQAPFSGAGSRTHAFDTSVVGPVFFQAASTQGLSVLELCGGLATGLRALLECGVRVRNYYYVDRDDYARRIVKHQLTELSAKYTDLFPVTAWSCAFDLPQDLRSITREAVVNTIPLADAPWLVIAGWPCQEYSPAGHGLVGQRAALLGDVLRVVRRMQESPGQVPPAYILENVAMQHNFRHGHVRWPVYEELVSRLGKPITFDSTSVGSRAHRLRNFWTNLVEPEWANEVFSNLHCPVSEPLETIMGEGRAVQPVGPDERAHSRVPVNRVGSPRKAFPTFTSYPFSRAFRPGRPGSVWDSIRQQWDEPNASEREAAMGYDLGATEAPGVSDRQRCRLLGQAMDVHSLCALWEVCKSMCDQGFAAPSSAYHPSIRFAYRKTHVNAARAAPADVSKDHMSVEVDESGNDIWSDKSTMHFLRESVLPDDAQEASRVRKRIRNYRWAQGMLYRFVKDKRLGQMSMKQVPAPSTRDALVMHIHHALGHLGEKRTTDALVQVYWWQGMTLDVKRCLSTCKVCRRVNSSPTHLTHEMQTESHDDYGMFYRWGLDYLGELPPSASGNKYALIVIDYFSKWVEVFPVVTADAATTVKLVLLNIIARYGVPGEVVTDNGAPFLGEFESFCKEQHIDQHFITPGMPRSNGLAENAVKTIKRALQKHAAEVKGAHDWDTEGLAKILLGYRCTKQAATGFSPAQVLFAQDPAINADLWLSREPALDYLNHRSCADELIRRSDLARELCVQVVENLRLAHQRNAMRFKALRSGLYKPKVHHFREGDFVYVHTPDAQVPGGALGIPLRDEILKVVEVRPTNVLLLENQGGRRFTRHVEQCVPCNLSNVEGTVHPELIKPSWKYPCTVCGDHRQPSKMLLCDGCNLGFHTYCLPTPLDVVPDGIWLCHGCITAGLTTADVEKRRRAYIPAEISRPNLELPSPARRAEARKLAADWHGQAVRHTSRKDGVRYGRVTFTDVTSPKWFRIYWTDGENSYHDKRFLIRLERIPDDECPEDLLPRPQPVTVLSFRQPRETWSVRTADDILARLRHAMPGHHSTHVAHKIHASLNHHQRKRLTGQYPSQSVEMLNAVIDFSRCNVILDPWAGNKVVQKGLFTGGSQLVLNDVLARKGVHMQLEPLEPHLYRHVVSKLGRLDAIVMAPPPLLADFALVNALDFAGQVVCMLVSDVWSAGRHESRDRLFSLLDSQNRLLWIRESDPGELFFEWVCVFESPECRHRLVRAGMDNDGEAQVVVHRLKGRS